MLFTGIKYMNQVMNQITKLFTIKKIFRISKLFTKI